MSPKRVYEIDLVIRGALADALRRGLVTRNVALLVWAPKQRSLQKIERAPGPRSSGGLSCLPLGSPSMRPDLIGSIGSEWSAARARPKVDSRASWDLSSGQACVFPVCQATQSNEQRGRCQHRYRDGTRVGGAVQKEWTHRDHESVERVPGDERLDISRQ